MPTSPHAQPILRRKAAVFCNTFLPYSQTFIWDELRSHDRYDVEVFAWRRLNSHLFPGPANVARPWYPLTCRSAEFEKRFATGRFDVVHAHFGWAGVHAAHFSARYNLPLVVTFHGYDVALLASTGLGPPTVWPYTLRRERLLEAMTLGLCASAELLELLVSAGVPRGKLQEHRLGVDLELFKPAARDSSIVSVAMVGRFVAKKGFADGIDAFAHFVRQSGTASRLSIVGSGPLESDLRARVRDRGLESQVEFMGELPHVGVAQLLSKSDVLLAPSAVAADGDRDSGLLSAKEASACECIPIATRHGGIPSIIDDGITGYLVDEHAVEAMANRLFELAIDPSLRKAMGSAARQKMLQQYELRSSVRRLEEHYDCAILRHTPSDRRSDGIRDSMPSSQK